MLIRAMTRGLRPGVLFPREILKSDLSMLVRTLTAVKLSEPSSYCSIKKLEVNQKISQMKLDRKDFLDKSVIHILKKDIQVLEVPLMLDKRMTYNSLKNWNRASIPDSIKFGKWNPDDDELIRNNLDNLVNEMRSKKNRDAFIENIFSPSGNEFYKEKINIVGSALGQGLSDPRLPCEIFYRASKLIRKAKECSQRITFTEEDDKTIIEYLKNNKTDTAPFVSLSKLLGYPVSAIHQRNKRILLQGDKRKAGAYSEEENREIMTAVFQDDKDALNQLSVPSDPFWNRLGKKLNRRPFNVHQHWELVIKSALLLYEHKKENVDFRPIMIDYFVENNIKYRNETSWGEVMKDDRFKGTTPLLLQRHYCDLVMKVKKKYPGIGDAEITSQVIKSYLDGINKQPTKNAKGGFSRLIEDYVAIKNE